MTVMGVRLQPRSARPTASACIPSVRRSSRRSSHNGVEWGEAGLVDIIGCLGNFSMPAMLLNAFQVELKPGVEPPFPDVRGFAKVEPEAAGQ
jgi:hypothetical protein